MENNILETAVVSRANPERKVYNATKMRIANQIPDEILNDEKLAAAMSSLPPNYNFEIHKMVNIPWVVSHNFLREAYIVPGLAS